MQVLRRLTGTVLALVLLATLGLAQDRPVATLKMADGTTIRGNATKYDSPTETLYFTTTDGRALQLKMSELDARSAYLLNRSNLPKDDAEGQLQLGNFARDAGLYAHASRHYKYALAADPALKPEVDKEVAKLKSEAAAYCMVQLKAAQADGDKQEATRWAKILLDKLPDTPEAQLATQMMDGLYKDSHESRDDDLEKSGADLLAGELKKAKTHYDRMLEDNKKGLVAKNQGSAKRAFDASIKNGNDALKEIDRVAKKDTDPANQKTIEGYRALVVEHMVEIHINLASTYMTRTSYQQALQETNKALALDPQSEAALSMRSRVEMAASRGIGIW